MSYMQARSNKLSQARRSPRARNPRAMRNPSDMKRDKEFQQKWQLPSLARLAGKQQSMLVSLIMSSLLHAPRLTAALRIAMQRTARLRLGDIAQCATCSWPVAQDRCLGPRA